MNNEVDLALLHEWLNRVNTAKNEAHKILAFHEQSLSRVVILEDLLKKLDGLPVDVQDYFREAITCLEQNLLRASIVLSWSGFFHVLVEDMYSNHEIILRNSYPKWKFNDLAELKENYIEFQLLEAARFINLINKAELRVYQGQLAERNRCAHPTLYRPSLNSALGYVDSTLRQTIKIIK